MISSRLPWLAGLLVCGVLLPGCGSSGSSTASQQSRAGSTASSAPTASSATTGASTATAAEVKVCHQTLQADKAVPAPAKSRLEADCVTAATGDKAAVRRAQRDACAALIESSPIASGTLRERALKACKSK